MIVENLFSFDSMFPIQDDDIHVIVILFLRILRFL